MYSSICDTNLGKVIIFATDKGISRVCFNWNLYYIIDKECIPNFLLGPTLKSINNLNNYSVPLDLDTATPFRKIVWEAIQSIPRGETATYSDIAKAIGKPKAVRAVANACAANSIAVLIPCHRVIRNDGSLGGYRWGKTKKSELLHKENNLGTI